MKELYRGASQRTWPRAMRCHREESIEALAGVPVGGTLSREINHIRRPTLSFQGEGITERSRYGKAGRLRCGPSTLARRETP
jgi:hypothetical protein